MATSGSKSVTVTSWDTLKFSWEIDSQSVSNNTSTVSWKMELIATSSGRISSSAQKAWSVTVNGTTYSGKNYISISNNSTKTLASGTTTITHNADGTKSFSYSFKQAFDITFSGSSIGTKSGSGSGTLTAIPRKSTLTVGNGTLKAEQTLTVTRQSSSFTHTITYSCGNAGGTICTKSSSTSIKFTPPEQLAKQNTTGTSLSVKYTITTYNGSTSLGSNSYTKTLTVPSSIKPSCSIAVSDATGYSSTYGGYVKGLSKFKIEITPTLAYDSPIALYTVKANGATYSKATVTTDILKSAGTLYVTASVKDKRGISSGTIKSSGITVIDYSAPVVTNISVGRCNSDGTDNEQGEYVSVTFDAIVTSLSNKNTSKFVLKYKKNLDTTFTSVELSDYSNQFNVTGAKYVFAADTGSSYNVEIHATDNHNTTIKTTTVSTSVSIMHWMSTGLGIGFGKISERERTVEMGWHLWSLFGEVISSPVELGTGTDLNDILDLGFYIIPTTAISETVLNKPFWHASDTSTAYMEVLPGGNSQQRIQRYYSCSKNNQFTFQRTYYQTSWSDWMIVGGSTDWRNLTLASDFVKYSTNTEPKWRANGHLVTVKGSVKPTATKTSNTTEITFASGIPEHFRPPIDMTFVCQGSGINRWLLTVNTDGTLSASRYGTNAYVDIGTSAWLTFCATYSI